MSRPSRLEPSTVRCAADTTTATDSEPAMGVRTVNMLEAKTQLSRLVEAIELGQEREVVIARNGRPVARLTSLRPQRRPRRSGVAKGLFVAPASIDGGNALVAELFEQA